MKKLSVGIVGYGVVGKRRRMCIDQHPKMQTSAVCDVRFNKDGSMIDEKEVKSKYKALEGSNRDAQLHGVMNDGIPFYTNYRGLLTNHHLDVLFVSLPNYLAAEVTAAGLRNAATEPHRQC